MAETGSTKQAIAEAMKTLMQTTPFSKISVGEICEVCEMNRKSFYYHFEDKYDLVNWIFHTEFVSAIHMRDYENGWELIGDICTYFYRNRKFYRNALEVEGQNSFQEYFHELLSAILRMHLEEVFQEEEESEFFIDFFSDAMIHSIVEWLQQTPCRDPEEYVKLLRSAVGGFAHMAQSLEQKEEKILPD